MLRLAVAGAVALGCSGGRLGSPVDAGFDLSTAEVGVSDRPASIDRGPQIITDGGSGSTDGGSTSGIDGPVLVVGPDAETIVAARCDVWSRAAPDAGRAPAGDVAGWGRQLVEGTAMAVSADAQGRIALVSRHAREVDFGSGAVMSPQGILCSWLSSFTADGTHRWSRGIAAAAYTGGVSSWPDGDIAVVLGTAVARFDSDGAVRWVRRFETVPRTITAQSDGSLILATPWTDGTQSARLRVNRLSPTGDVLSDFSFGDPGLASIVSVSPAGDVFLVQNVDTPARYFSVTKVDAGGRAFWVKSFSGSGAGLMQCLAAAPTADGGIVLSGWSSGDADFGGGRLLAGAASVSFAVSFDADGRHLASRAFGDSAYLRHSFAKPGGGVVIADNFTGTRTFDGTSIHTGSTGDDDFLILDLDATLRVTRVARFGNGGGDQLLADVALASDGAVLIAGSFETKLDLGWGLMRTAAFSDAFLTRVTKDSPAPSASTPSAGEPSLPADHTPPAPPQVACDPAATGTICDLPVSQCPGVSADAGFQTLPNWVAYYENPRCVAGRCVWDQRYFPCWGTWACFTGACGSTTLAATGE